jgi:preprotein translocase subunit YajC
VHASLLATIVAALPNAASSGSKGGGGSLTPLLFPIVIVFAAYLLFIRPARNRQRAVVSARREVQVGDEIITTSGLIATVTEVADDFLTLEIAPGVRARYVPAAVLRVVSDEPEEDQAPDVTNHEVIETPDESSDSSDGQAST